MKTAGNLLNEMLIGFASGATSVGGEVLGSRAERLALKGLAAFSKQEPFRWSDSAIQSEQADSMCYGRVIVTELLPALLSAVKRPFD